MELRSLLDEIVEKALADAALWDEVKDNLKKSALSLSGAQQQRLCIAAFFSTDESRMGQLIEIDDAQKIFTNANHSRTRDYVEGRFG